MRWLVMIIGLLGCQGEGSFGSCPNIATGLSCPPPADVTDAPVDPCNPIAQVGCIASEKCTWIEDSVDDPAVGHIGCVPLSGNEVGPGEACTYGPAGALGFDNCQKGLVCVAGECKSICDPQRSGVDSGCVALHGCARYEDLFEVGDVEVAGACEVQCDPLEQNLLLETEPTTAACGSVMPDQPDRGCYTSDFNEFLCSPVTAETLSHTDRSEPARSPAGNPFTNGCAPGYVPFFSASTGSTTVLCTGLCAAANISSEPPEDENDTGLDAASAKLVGKAMPEPGDGLCEVGKKGSASGGPQNCVMLWSFLVDSSGSPGPSPYNESVGVCFSFERFQYDSDNDLRPDSVYKDCKTLPKRNRGGPDRDQPTPLVDDDAADFGCQTIAESSFDGRPTAPMMRGFRVGTQGAWQRP